MKRKLNLNVDQTRKIFEIAELHVDYLRKYGEKVPSFEIILELNINKLKYNLSGNAKSADIDTELEKLKKIY